jgi:glycosyltransferase 2 family protein
MNRSFRVGLTLVVSMLAFTYIVVKIDVHKTARIIGNASPLWVATSISLIFVMVFPMAWRWRLLLRARGISESLVWLLRAYFVSLAVGQVLPTSVGGDASRLYEAARRHRGQGGTIAASVLVERALGGVVTLLLAAVGFLLAIGRYPIGAYLWIELVLVFGAIVLGFVFFSQTARERLGFAVPLARRLRVERLSRAIYGGVHSYRNHRGTLGVVSLATVVVQVGGILSIYAAGRAVGIHVSLLAYVVLGPLLFLVTLVPFTINGLGVREAFFVNFFAKLHVAPDAAFACGFLFFLTSLVLALPGLGVILREGFRRNPTPDASI